MRVNDFDFHLPGELIAQRPPAERGTSRMLLLDRKTGRVADKSFGDLPRQLRAGDLLVLNDSRVLPARLYATRERASRSADAPGPSGRIEVLLTRPRTCDNGRAEHDWEALVRPGRKVRLGETLLFAAREAPAEPLLRAQVVSVGEFGERVLRFAPVNDFGSVVERIGHLPLPPYIHRAADDPATAEDRERYQTVYASGGATAERGSEERSVRERSVAAPTAGLHFTPELLTELRKSGVLVEMVTLHVGLGTFQPVRVQSTEDVRLHAERYTLPEATAAAINLARIEGRRVIAVGTTTTRTLEHCALAAERAGRCELAAVSGETSLFLSPGHRFRIISGLLTNFHLPQSTLLMLVCAFAGTDPVLRAYAYAVTERYRFFSYGDCMLIL